MDTLYYNGSIVTMEEQREPEAVVVKDGVIGFVGELAEARRVAGSGAEPVDLGGRCLMPGFIDPHGHIVMAGQMSMHADLSGCTSHEEIVRTLEKYIAARNPGPEEVVMGTGYDHNFLAEGTHPDRRVLDRVSSRVPIMVLHASSHFACVNSRLLALAGITAGTPDPQGGVIGRLPGSREPSGYLEEGGMTPAQRFVQEHLRVEPERVIAEMQRLYLEQGITTAQDGAATETELRLLKGAAEQGKLKLDVVAYPMLTAGGAELLHRSPELAGRYQNRLKLGGYKIVLDGSPQGRSAWLSRPYLNGEAGYCGYPWMPDEEVAALAATALREGRQLLAHCNGDAASQQLLDAYEAALRETGCKRDLRPVMIHCQTVRQDQLRRMAAIGMMASIFVGHVYYWGDIHLKNLGPERGRRISPVREAIDCGVKVNFHQDTPVTRPDMLHSVWCAVNRISRGGAVIGPEQRVSVREALRAVTLGGAYQYFEEDTKGSIRAGKRADLVILDRSPLEADPLSIKDIRVLATIKDGEVLYQRN